MKLRWILLSGWLTILTSCASLGPKSGPKLERAEVQKIKRCETTKDELIAKFGTPDSDGSSGDYSMIGWSYPIYAGGYKNQEVKVFVDENNLVIDFVINPKGDVEAKNQCKAG